MTGVDSDEKEIKREYSLSPERNRTVPKEWVYSLLPDMLQDTTPRYFTEIDVESFSDAKVTVVDDNSEFTFSLWDEEGIKLKLQVEEDDDRVDIVGGHPTPRSISSVAREFMNYIIRNELPPDTEEISEETILQDVDIERPIRDQAQRDTPRPEW